MGITANLTNPTPFITELRVNMSDFNSLISQGTLTNLVSSANIKYQPGGLNNLLFQPACFCFVFIDIDIN